MKGDTIPPLFDYWLLYITIEYYIIECVCERFRRENYFRFWFYEMLCKNVLLVIARYKQARREGGSWSCSPGVRASKRARARLSPPGLIFDFLFTLYHIICISDNTIFAFKYFTPRTLNQYNYKNTHFFMINKNIVNF